MPKIDRMNKANAAGLKMFLFLILMIYLLPMAITDAARANTGFGASSRAMIRPVMRPR